ncbi:titin-like [Arapaima gigas]
MLQEAESIGSSAVFECQISPSTAVTTWMKDGSNLRESPKHKFTSDGKDRKLAIIDVQLSDTGEYTCVAKLGNKEKTSTAKLIVEELPVRFTKTLEEEISVIKGQPTYLTCELSKERDVVWKKNGIPLQPIPGKLAINIIGLQHAVTIQNADDDDSGVYSCECENLKTQGNVKVVEIEMDFTIPLKDVSVPEKKQALFECTITRDVPKVMWLKGSDIITSGTKYDIIDDGKKHMLLINECEFDDEDQYTIEVLDKKSTARLTVEEADPYFTVKLQDCAVVEKDEMILDCELSKDVPVKWYHNETEIKASKMVSMKTDGKRRILSIKRVDDKDKGTYACDCGTDKTVAEINIEARDIKVIRPLYGVELFDGETARFEVEISEDDVPGQWNLKGEVLAPSPDVEITEHGTKHTLTLYNCKVSQSGEVSFQAANAKCAANLKVKELPLTFITPLADVQVFEKDEARFECEVSREVKRFRWLKGSQELRADEKFEILNEGKKHIVVVKCATYEDEARYMFEAENKKTSAKLIIKGIRLEFIKLLKDVTVKEKDPAEFRVELSHENVAVIWYKNDVRLHPSKVVHMSEGGKVHTLTLKEVSLDDTSLIKAEALGKTAEATLTVLGT